MDFDETWIKFNTHCIMKSFFKLYIIVDYFIIQILRGIKLKQMKELLKHQFWLKWLILFLTEWSFKYCFLVTALISYVILTLWSIKRIVEEESNIKMENILKKKRKRKSKKRKDETFQLFM